MKITEDENNQTDEFSYSNKSQTPEQEEIIIWQLKVTGLFKISVKLKITEQLKSKINLSIGNKVITSDKTITVKWKLGIILI